MRLPTTSRFTSPVIIRCRAITSERDDVLSYFHSRLGRISGGRGGFEVEHLFAGDDEYGGSAMVQGTAFNGDEPFTRPIIHVARIADGRFHEIWDNPFDQYAEDRFWRAAFADDRSG